MCFVGSPRKMKHDDGKTHHDLPFYDLKSIVTATENFAAANKLGEDGFGSVYKVPQYTKLDKFITKHVGIAFLVPFHISN